jgi:hypothetical protein
VLLEWNRKIVKDISKIWGKLRFYQQYLSLGALLDFQTTVKGNVFFCQKWIKFSLATHRKLLL